MLNRVDDGWGDADDLGAFEGLAFQREASAQHYANDAAHRANDAAHHYASAPGPLPSPATRKKPVRAKTPAPALVGSEVLAALESALADVRARHPEVPADVVVVVSGARPRERRLGHFWGERWQSTDETLRHEIWISAQHLANGPAAVLETIIHEAAHAANHAAGIKDCSRQCHNKAFAARAEAFGLTVLERSRTYGLGHTALPPGTEAGYLTTLEGLQGALGGWRLPDGAGAKPKEKQRLLRAVCPGCSALIRLSAAVMASSEPKCGACDVPFELVEAEG